MANYRAPQPSVREAQWRQVRTAVAPRAVHRPATTQHFAPRFATATAISTASTARHARRAGRRLRRSGSSPKRSWRFAKRRSSGLDWPDPYLGLARTFIYGLDDVDRAADALRAGGTRGYVPGNREAAQLGDGYRARGDALARSARDVAGWRRNATI